MIADPGSVEQKAPDRATPPEPDGEDVVVFDSVTKSYGAVTALDGLDLRVRNRRITALLGPNGAGKTTMLEILAGIRRADSGAVRVLGLDPATDRHALAERLGVQVQEFMLQSTVTARESLAFFASLYTTRVDVDVLLERFGLSDKAGTRFPRLSGGQKRRLAIAKALVGDPALVVLDEPTSGLDPQGQEFLRRETRRLRSEGRSVLLSTHDVADAEELADDVLVMDRGRLVAAGTPAGIVAEHCLGWRTVADPPLPSLDVPGIPLRRVDEPDRTVLFTRDAQDARLLLGAAGRDDVRPGRAASLHDAFLLLTGAELRS